VITERLGGAVPTLQGFQMMQQFSHHFKRLGRVTPGQFRTPARFA
jgi:hypothetical protein